MWMTIHSHVTTCEFYLAFHMLITIIIYQLFITYRTITLDSRLHRQILLLYNDDYHAKVTRAFHDFIGRNKTMYCRYISKFISIMNTDTFTCHETQRKDISKLREKRDFSVENDDANVQGKVYTIVYTVGRFIGSNDDNVSTKCAYA